MKASICSLALVAVLFGCSDDTKSASPPATTPEGKAPTLDSLRVLVLYGNATDPEKALANATVVMDKPGSERIQLQTGPDGIATFTDIDWNLGAPSITAFGGGEGSSITSYVGYTKEQFKELRQRVKFPRESETLPPFDVVSLIIAPAPEMVRVEGEMSNGIGNAFTLSTTVMGTSYQNSPGPWQLDVRKGYPFSVIGLDWSLPAAPTVSARGAEQILHRWVKVDHAPVVEKTRFDFDFNRAEQLTQTVIKGKIVIPGGDAGPLGATTNGYAYINTVRSNGNGFVGVVSKLDVSADKSSFEYDLGYTKLANETPSFINIIQKTSDGSYTYSISNEWPADNVLIDDLLTLPVIVETTRTLTEPFAIDAPADTDIRINFARRNTNVPSWYVQVPPNAKTATLPTLDATMKKQLGALDDLTGTVVALGKLDPVTNYYTRVSSSRPFKVK